MKRVGVHDAKTQLPRLLDEVERGASITITRHGKPIARLVPVEAPKRTVEQAVEESVEFGKRHELVGLSIRELIDSGRRY